MLGGLPIKPGGTRAPQLPISNQYSKLDESSRLVPMGMQAATYEHGSEGRISIILIFYSLIDGVAFRVG